MMWHDILIERVVADGELRTALAAAFGIDDTEVQIVSTLEDFTDKGMLTAHRRETKGDFRLAVGIHVEPSLQSAIVVEVIRRFCGSLRTRVLISDASVNPYSMRLVTPVGDVTPVFLDPESLDDREEYRLMDTQ